jgi:hypothetical protein
LLQEAGSTYYHSMHDYFYFVNHINFLNGLFYFFFDSVSFFFRILFYFGVSSTIFFLGILFILLVPSWDYLGKMMKWIGNFSSFSHSFYRSMKEIVLILQDTGHLLNKNSYSQMLCHYLINLQNYVMTCYFSNQCMMDSLNYPFPGGQMPGNEQDAKLLKEYMCNYINEMNSLLTESFKGNLNNMQSMTNQGSLPDPVDMDLQSHKNDSTLMETSEESSSMDTNESEMQLDDLDEDPHNKEDTQKLQEEEDPRIKPCPSRVEGALTTATSHEEDLSIENKEDEKKNRHKLLKEKIKEKNNKRLGKTMQIQPQLNLGGRSNKRKLQKNLYNELLEMMGGNKEKLDSLTQEQILQYISKVIK